jgi:hypothetical protein
MKSNLLGTAENVLLLHGVIEKWVTLKTYLLKGFEPGEIAVDDEAHFLEIKSDVTRSIRSLSERLGETRLDYGDKLVREMLGKCVSVNHVQSLPAADKRSLIKDWHKAFVLMSRTSGALAFLADGYVPPSPKKAAAGGSKGASPAKNPAVIVIVLVVLAVAGYFLYDRFMG